MEKHLRNITALLLSGMLAASLAACGGGGESGSAPRDKDPTPGLEATWGTNLLASGSEDNWWKRGTMEVSSNGSASVLTVDSSGTSNNTTDTLTISDDGTVTIGSDGTFSGHCDSNDTVIHGITAYNSDPTGLFTALKQADSYSLAVLEGAWGVNILVSGPSSPWWERGALTVNASGEFTATTTDIFGDPGYLSYGGIMNITAKGIITIDEYPSLEGRMDSDKTVIVWTDKWHNDTMELAVLTRQAAAYSTADLEGTWTMSTLSTGAYSPVAGKGTAMIAPDGTAGISYENSSGESGEIDRALSITPEGTVTIEGFGTVEGYMDSGKTVMVFTQTVDFILDISSEITIFTKGTL
jgi:hypothetical protein